MTEPKIIVVEIVDGVLGRVVSDDPEGLDVQVFVVDEDTDGADFDHPHYHKLDGRDVWLRPEAQDYDPHYTRLVKRTWEDG